MAPWSWWQWSRFCIGGIGALWSLILVAQALRAHVADGVRMTDIGTGATTYDTQHKNTQEKREGSMQRPHQKQVKQVELALGNCHLGDLTTTVVPHGCAGLKF